MPPLAGSGAMRMGVLDPGSVNLGGRGRGRAARAASTSSTPTATATSATWSRSSRRAGSGRASRSSSPGSCARRSSTTGAGRLPRGAFVKLYFGGDHELPRRRRARGVTFGLPPTRDARSRPTSRCSRAATCRGRSRSSAATSSRAASRASRSSAAATCASGSRTTRARRSRRTSSWWSRWSRSREAVGRPVATPADAAQLLDLPR